MIAPLLVTSCYSLLYGIARPEELVQSAAALGYKALALTDRNAVYGLPSFIDACKEAHIRPILGSELVYPGGRAVVLAKNKRGFARLSSLLTLRAEAAFTASDCNTNMFDMRSALVADHEGLVVITDDVALLNLSNYSYDIYALLSPYNRSLWHTLMNVQSVATGEVRFLKPDERELQRVLLAISQKTTMSRIDEEELGDRGALLPSPQAFAAAYEAVPEALLCNEAVTDAASYSELFQGFVFPTYGTWEEGGTKSLLRERVLQGASHRYRSVDEKVLQRIDYELAIIKNKGFCDYFLTVQDIAQKASCTCGRGSAAASIVSYCLGITDVDPLRHNLYFDRFLNPGRVDPPDIDVDFAWDERDALLNAVIEQYGPEHAARVANHVCFQRQAALRETARAFGIPDTEISAFERRQTLGTEESEASLDATWTTITQLAARLEGLPRNLGVHSGGLIVVPDNLVDHVPIERSGSGIRITAWEKEGVEAVGLVKIDLLGNRSLAVVRDALANLQENGITIDKTSWDPIEDTATIDLLARGDTMGVFYVESPPMRLLQQKTHKGDFEHLVIHSSMIRPAANAYINEYIDRLHGKPWKSLHPLLDGLFDETFGILCYQEDASKAAIALAGFSAAEADRIRKALAKRDADVQLQRFWPAFERGARERGVDDATVIAVWDMIRSFTGYSFVKAHSASYAMLSFKSAYLRAHYPAEFMAAVISNRGGYYSTLAYASECRRMGLTLLPPDVNQSEVRCRGKGKDIRWGLGLIVSFQEKVAERIVEERKMNGFYTSIDDFSRRIGPDRETSEALVGSGALDSLALEQTRAQKLMRLFAFQSVKEHKNEERELFEDLSSGADNSSLEFFIRKTPKRLPSVELEQLEHVEPGQSTKKESKRKILETQMKYLTTTLACHPLELVPRALSYPRVRACEIGRFVGNTIQLLGWPITAKVVLTTEKEQMEFVSFEDETALYETVLFPDVYRKYRHLLYDQRPLVIRGKVQEDRGAITVEVLSVSIFT